MDQEERQLQEKLKYLEFLQNNIKRMNDCSFKLKGITSALVTAMIGVFISKDGFHVEDSQAVIEIFIAFAIVIVTMWGLDSYYLKIERIFRAIYNNYIKPKEKIETFSFPMDDYDGNKTSYFSVFFSKSELFYYGAFLMVLIILYQLKG